jgi:hypothetical protein
MRFLALILALFFGGCFSAQKSRVSVKDGAPKVEQRGAVEEPGTASANETTVSLPIPAGSSVSVGTSPAIDESQRDVAGVTNARSVTAWAVTVSKPTELRIVRRESSVSGPKTFAPPPPPSLSEKAAAKASWLYRVGLFAGVLLVGAGIYWKGPMIIAGGVTIIAASVFGWWVEENPWLLWVMGGGTALAALGFAAWHLWLKPRHGLIEKNALASASVATPS